MTDEVAAPAESAPIASEPTAPPSDKMLSVREAARLLQSRRKKQGQEAPQAVETPQDSAEPASTEPSESTPIGETAVESEPSEETPITPPVSWTAEDKERFAQLPPEVQRVVSERENARDTEVRRNQNLIAERMKALEPEAAALQQARWQYEQALPAVLQAMQSNPQFADIRTVDDVERLARDDWPRYVQWDAHTKKVQAVQQEAQAAQYRQAQEFQAHWQNYANQQDQMFAQKVPEFQDDSKREALQKLTINTLEKDYGFTPQEMAYAWNGAFRDHRVQQLLLDAARYRQLKKNPPKPADKSVPPVQRPGVATPRGATDDAAIRALEKKSALSVKEAARLAGLRRAGRQ